MTVQLPTTARAASIDNPVDRDLELSDADLDRISALIRRRAGIVLSRQKHGMVYGRLAKRVRQLGFFRFRDYLDYLQQQMDGEEGERFVNALTTNLTAFFREPHHFDLLAQHLAGRTGPVRIWCSAASTGEEPYSIAMTLRQALGERCDAQVVATDIDTDALARARDGLYPLDQVRKLESRNATRFFLRGQGKYERWARVRPELASMVQFVPVNLVAPVWPSLNGPFDAIFCRNVMIYFDKDTQARILSRFVPLLKPNGLLFAGHSENFSYISNAFRLRGQTVYTLA